MFWYVEQFSIIAIHFDSTYFNQFFTFLKKLSAVQVQLGVRWVLNWS